MGLVTAEFGLGDSVIWCQKVGGEYWFVPLASYIQSILSNHVVMHLPVDTCSSLNKQCPGQRY